VSTPAPAPPAAVVAPVDTAKPAAPPADTAFPTAPPTLGPPPAVTLPPTTERTLPNGLRLLVVEQHELPLADVVLVVGTGGEADPPNRSGVATLTADLLTEGTATRSSLQIADQTSFLGVQLDASAAWDLSTVTLHAPTAQLDSALALFADVVTRPSFPQREFDRVKRERLTDLLQLRDEPTAIADRAFGQTLFGAAHAYGRPLGGSEATTRATTRADVERFWRAYYRPNNATLIVVGDVTPDDAARRVERALGAWPRADVPGPIAPTPPPARATSVVLVDKPGAPQTSVRIGLVGVPRTTADYFPLLVMNTVLGGSFTSRLNQNLRETHGYTYGASSGFGMRRGAGPFQARAEVTGAKTDSALAEFMKELRAIADTVPNAELAKAKRYLQLQLPGEFETTGDIAARLVPLVVYGLPLDYYGSYVQRVEAVSQGDVQRVARRYLDASHLLVIVVGDRKSIEPGVRALDLGPLTVRQVRDVLDVGAVP
jgi:predicted Zn-dependent peptidase